MWKKLTAVATLAAGLLIGSVVPAEASNKPTKTEVPPFPVSWTIDSANCTQLPAGTTVTGSGMMTVETTTRVDQQGVTHVRFVAQAEGEASDQDGNAYVFRYANNYQIHNSVEQPHNYNGLMVDHFSLRGHGPAALSNGFTARGFEDFAVGTFGLDPISVHGDPFAFPSGPGLCDPP